MVRQPGGEAGHSAYAVHAASRSRQSEGPAQTRQDYKARSQLQTQEETDHQEDVVHALDKHHNLWYTGFEVVAGIDYGGRWEPVNQATQARVTLAGRSSTIFRT